MLALLSNFKNVFLQSDLRRKLFFTLWVLGVYRLGVHIPLPGIDTNMLAGFLNSESFGSGFFKYFDLLSGGALKKVAIFALGVGPYIQASIFMQVLGLIVPSLEALSKEGESGRRILNGYTRNLSVAIAIVQSFIYVTSLEYMAPGIVMFPGWKFKLLGTIILSAGSVFVMWLGEQILQRGIGQGSSMIIFAGIVAGLPEGIFKIYSSISSGNLDWGIAALIVGFLLSLVCVIVFIERGERRVNVQYAKRVIGQKIYGGISRHIPFKINPAGVVPVIFTSALLGMPVYLLKKLLSFEWLSALSFIGDWLDYGSPIYTLLTVLFIIFFSFVYTSIIMDPNELADNLRKSGGFVSALRPGRQTAEFFEALLLRIGLPGAFYLATLAVFPDLLLKFLSSPIMFSGTSLLIAVGTGLETSNQLDTALLDKKYEGFLSVGKARKKYD
ncbi:preprotein translocase subunit SecY [Candidatus Dependentiae bacterium]|nr:preprotein translocase subunit SecY [Candidatus Dependentiae bacterium]